MDLANECSGRARRMSGVCARARVLAAVGSAVLLGGCAVGPDFLSPPAPEVETYTPDKVAGIDPGRGPGRSAGQKLDYGADIPRRWWGVFRNRPLNDLIVAAIEHSPTLQAAEAGIKAAYYNAEAQK